MNNLDEYPFTGTREEDESANNSSEVTLVSGVEKGRVTPTGAAKNGVAARVTDALFKHEVICSE